MGWTHYFDEDFAVKHGLHKAIVYEKLRAWIRHNAANGQNRINGKTWTYGSKQAWQAQLPFLSEKQVRSALDGLRDDGIILAESLSPKSWDRTLWYALKDESDVTVVEDALAPEGRDLRPLEANAISPEGQSTTTTPLEDKKDKNNKAAETSFPTDADSPVGILSYLNAKTGKSYRSTTAANLAGIRARLKDGFTAEDCRKVIDVKHAEWWDAAETRKYVNPVTLFRPANFERYLQQEPESAVVVSETAKELCRKLAEESQAELTAAQKVKWAEDMQLLLDGGAVAERLRRVIVFAWFPGCWWNGKIASPSDLARHHEKLYAQAMALEKDEEARM